MNAVEPKILSSTLVIEEQEIDIKASSAPSVTIGIPVLNEEGHIERVVRGFLGCGYPNLIEILIADGGSTDRTREIISGISQEDARVKLVENPQKFQSFGLNIMIDKAVGDVFLRADAHCYYKENYVTKCIEVLLETGARNVGGSQRYKAENTVQAGIAIAVKSFLGNGGAKYMNDQYEGYGDTVFLGCFWTNDLKRVGNFSTDNITNQDSELNLRLIEAFGDESVFISPNIQSWYFPRDTLWKLFKQYFRYGRGRFITKVHHPQQSPIRGMLPFLFICTLSILVISDLIIETSLSSIWVLGILFLILLTESMKTVSSTKEVFSNEIWSSNKKEPNFIVRVFITSISLALMQIGHFSGFLYQVLRRVILQKKGW